MLFLYLTYGAAVYLYSVGTYPSSGWVAPSISNSPDLAAGAYPLRQGPISSVHQGPTASIGQLKGSGRIYLVYLLEAGNQPAHYIALDDFAYWLHEKYAIDVQVLPTISLSESALDPERNQYIAELLLNQIKQEYPALAADPNAYLFGFTDADMYSTYENWTGTFSQRDDPHRIAIISSDGMRDSAWRRRKEGEELADAHFQARLRRILLKDVAVLYWHLPLNNNPGSLLYHALNPDVPVEDVYESDIHPARTRWGQYERDPTIVFTYSGKGGIQPLPGRLIRSWWDQADPGHDDSVELFQIVLGDGIIVDKHTDFYIQDTVPIQLQRVTRPGWTTLNAFGISGTDTYDKYLVTGDDMRHITVVGASSNENLVRVRFWPFLLGLDRWVDAEDSGRRLKLRWQSRPLEHFDLTKFDGVVESYLPCDVHTMCYQFGYRNGHGQRILFQRDGDRRLIRLTSPNRNWIRLSYGKGPAIAEIADSRGRTVHYSYNKLGQLISVKYPSGETYYYQSDSSQRLLTFSVALDTKTAPSPILRNDYDHGKLVKQTLAGGGVYSYSYFSGKSAFMHTVRVTTPKDEVYDIDIRGWDAAIREGDIAQAANRTR
jgi:hypothetical protein